MQPGTHSLKHPHSCCACCDCSGRAGHAPHHQRGGHSICARVFEGHRCQPGAHAHRGPGRRGARRRAGVGSIRRRGRRAAPRVHPALTAAGGRRWRHQRDGRQRGARPGGLAGGRGGRPGAGAAVCRAGIPGGPCGLPTGQVAAAPDAQELLVQGAAGPRAGSGALWALCTGLRHKGRSTAGAGGCAFAVLALRAVAAPQGPLRRWWRVLRVCSPGAAGRARSASQAHLPSHVPCRRCGWRPCMLPLPTTPTPLLPPTTSHRRT